MSELHKLIQAARDVCELEHEPRFIYEAIADLRKALEPFDARYTLTDAGRALLKDGK